MNICLHVRNKESGSVLVISMILALILGLTMGSYLYWVRSQNILTSESQAWNHALAAAEAGIEEGMAQINVSYGNVAFPTNYIGSIQTNWDNSVSGVYGPKINTNLLGASYSAIVVPGSPGPTITATGYTTVPYISRKISRTVRITTATSPVFANAMSALLGVTTKGSKLAIDSYDSTDPNHSTNGMYNAATHLAGGDIASVQGQINVQGSSVYGHIRTGPSGSYTIGNGSVGDLNWVGGGQSGVEPGYYANDFNMSITDILPPYNTGWSIPKNNNATNTYPLTTGNYYVNGDFVMNQNETMNVSGNVVLYVTGNFNMKSQNACTINVLPGGSLKLYVGNSTGSSVSANLTMVNTVGNAMTFQFFGLPTCTSMVWGGNNTYMGTVYAPEADFSCGGGGNNTYDFQGSCVVRSVSMNGKFNFHFDENLKRIGPITGFAVTSWKEL